jgi:hypothetical protein
VVLCAQMRGEATRAKDIRMVESRVFMAVSGG